MPHDRDHPGFAGTGSILEAYLLGSVEYDAALALQHWLLYQVTGDRSQAALVICEHPPVLTVGREGSRAHILYEPRDLHSRRWQIRWVNRGGGCLLHLPGQMAIYPILAIDQWGMDVRDYQERLQQVLVATLRDFNIRGETKQGQVGVWVNSRPIARLGIAIRQWVTYHGAILNVNPDLELCRGVLTDGSKGRPMTSLERERRGPSRPALVRERFLEHFAVQFQFTRTSLFFEHSSLSRKAPADAVAARP